jgi:hypothetical protein
LTIDLKINSLGTYCQNGLLLAIDRTSILNNIGLSSTESQMDKFSKNLKYLLQKNGLL